ncbi:hypothetical protein EON65_43680 [archaeon]|nr:MAG: hypothetical protein EON65_43680 [archaeon]
MLTCYVFVSGDGTRSLSARYQEDAGKHQTHISHTHAYYIFINILIDRTHTHISPIYNTQFAYTHTHTQELSDPVNSYNGQNMIVDILSALRVSLPLRAGEPLVLMAGNETLNAKDTLQCVYDRHKDRDGFLYLYYKR